MGLVRDIVVDEVDFDLEGVVRVERWNSRRDKGGRWGQIADCDDEVPGLLVICLHIIFDGLKGAPELIG